MSLTSYADFSRLVSLSLLLLSEVVNLICYCFCYIIYVVVHCVGLQVFFKD